MQTLCIQDFCFAASSALGIAWLYRQGFPGTNVSLRYEQFGALPNLKHELQIGLPGEVRGAPVSSFLSSHVACLLWWDRLSCYERGNAKTLVFTNNDLFGVYGDRRLCNLKNMACATASWAKWNKFFLRGGDGMEFDVELVSRSRRFTATPRWRPLENPVDTMGYLITRLLDKALEAINNTAIKKPDGMIEVQQAPAASTRKAKRDDAAFGSAWEELIPESEKRQGARLGAVGSLSGLVVLSVVLAYSCMVLQ